MPISHRYCLRTSILCALAAAAAAGDSDGGDYQATVISPIAPPMLGIEMSPVPTTVQEQDGLTPSQGVYVQNTFNNTAASSMGVQPGDVVLQVNGSTITSMSDLRNEIGMNAVGDPVDVVVQRGGQQLVMNAPLQPWPADIPKESLDPAAEQRFRDWQAQRLKQQQQQIDDVAKDLKDVADSLPAAHAKSVTADDLDQALGGKRPWALQYSLNPAPRTALVASVASVAAVAVATPDATASHPAWTFSWSNRTAAPGATP